MLLSKEEIEALAADLACTSYDMRAIEAAILAKLASAELPKLPEPSEMDGARWGYTSDDMQSHAIEAYAQGFAAGAASQLAEKPTCWAIFTEDGNARMWSTFQPHVQKLADAEGLAVTELYTRREAK